MGNRTSFKVTEIANRIENTKKKLFKVLISNGQDQVVEQLKSELNNIADEQKIRLVFIGQYTAGKSTIISALTNNNDIVIDSDISTCYAADYSWGDVILTDTPGLYTENIEHDVRTIEMIRKSDLLIYCITSDLFTPFTLQDFVKWAFTEKYSGKMFLIINKMSKESGDYKELIKNYSITLNKALSPHSINEFPCSFVDAKDYREGVTDQNKELVEYSHFSELIEHLNSFVKQKGYLGKMDTPIMIMKTIIDSVIDSTEEDESQKAYTTLMSRIEKRVDQKKNSFQIEARTIIHNGLQAIITKGNELSKNVGVTDISEDEESINSFIIQQCNSINTQLEALCIAKEEELSNDIEEVMNGETASFFFKAVDGQINNKFKIFEPKSAKVSRARFDSINGVLEKITGKTFDLAVKDGVKIGSAFIKPSEAAGSTLHKVVYGIGKKIGHKFRPWEAVKITKNIGNVAKCLGPVTAVFGLFFDIKETVDESKKAEELKKAQLSFRQEFVNIRDDLEQQYSNSINEMIDVYNGILSELRDSRNNVEKMIKANSEMSKQLSDIRNELVAIQCDLF